MSSDIISTILQWLNTHAEYSWLITFIISAGESIAVIGTIVPGSITMTAIGALAGSGIIPLWSTILWAFLGAIVGDSISYAIGYYFKDRLPQLWPFRQNLILLEKGNQFFNRYGGMGVFIGRFIGPIRALIPVVAGMMGMKPSHFFVANVASAAGWAPAYMLPGIALGAASLELPPDIATRVILILLFWTLFILLCLWLIRKIPLFIHHQIIVFFSYWVNKLQHSPKPTLIQKAFKDSTTFTIPLQLTLIFYFILMCVTFIALASYVHIHQPPNIFINQSIYHLFRGIFTPSGKDLMVYLTLLGQKQVLIPVACILIGWLMLTKQWHLAFHGSSLLLATVVSVHFIKNWLQCARPWGVVFSPESFSFPSGHTTLATVFYGSLILLTQHHLKSGARKFTFILLSSIIVIISVSRLYLGVHWFTDVVGAWILSAALLTLITIAYQRTKAKPINIHKLFSLTLVSLAMIYSIAAYYYVPRLKINFNQLDLPQQQTELATWWNQQDAQFLPEWRVSLFGFPSQSINIQWIGKLATIEKILVNNGWQKPPAREWIDILFRLSGIKSGEHLPLISTLYLDKKPSLVLTKNIPAEKKFLVIHFWQSNTLLKETQEPIWVGVIGLVPRTYGWLSHHYKMDLNPTAALLFNKRLPAHLKLKTIVITLPKKKNNPQQTIMLIRSMAQ